jgi:hypothetical protein
MSQKTKPQLPPRKLAHRIRCLARFAFGSPRRTWLPADSHAAALHQQLSSRMYKCDPVLHFLSLVFKYGPWKDALLSEWKAIARWPRVQKQPTKPVAQSAKSRERGAETEDIDHRQALANACQRCKAVQRLLASTARAMHKNPENPKWSANANRFGGRFNGPAAHMHLFCI